MFLLTNIILFAILSLLFFINKHFIFPLLIHYNLIINLQFLLQILIKVINNIQSHRILFLIIIDFAILTYLLHNLKCLSSLDLHIDFLKHVY